MVMMTIEALNFLTSPKASKENQCLKTSAEDIFARGV